MTERRSQSIAAFVIKVGVLFFVLLVAFSEAAVRNAANNALYENIEDIPVRRTALLLGTSQYSRSGGANRFFWNRIEAAAELYEQGKIEVIIASGDNRFTSYNEPESMRNALLERGVPDEAIVLDRAGFNTLDSVVRSKLVFGQSRITIISQEFHNSRAVFIAQHNDIDAIAYNADQVDLSESFSVHLREYFARVKAMIDVYVLRREPRVIEDERPI